MAKFIQYFDIISGKKREFRQFAEETYIPGIQATGLSEIYGRWNVVTGEGPFYILEAVSETPDDIYDLLENDEFDKLNRLMHFLITNYKSKVLITNLNEELKDPPVTGFRFNQHFNLNHQRIEEGTAFIERHYKPTMESLGLRIIGDWETLVGPGPNRVIETAANDMMTVLSAIGASDYYRVVCDLLKSATDFNSRILAPMSFVDQGDV